jgi:nitrile hydratase
MSGRDSEARVAPVADRARALAEALEAKGLVDEAGIDAVEATFTDRFDWRNGAKVVARAWTDEAYRERLLEDGTAACAELGFEGPQGEYIVALEAKPGLHHVIVCTQCSCTAWPVLGLPPDWYKSPAYRARVAREPRRVLHEMGLDVEPETRVRVWDTTAETRFIVLPLRPPETLGWSEEQLEAIVTRESMIGVARIEPRPDPGP